MIRVLVADDQAIIAEALAALLRTELDLEVVALANTAPESVRRAAEVDPDVVLMDVQMPGAADCKDGIEATAAIVAARPATKVIVLTTFGRPGYLRRAMEAGAVGFMVKDASADRLVDAIRRVSAGLRVVDPTLAADSLSIGPSPLTERETEVLAAAAGAGRQPPSPRRPSSARGLCATTYQRPLASSAPARGPRPSGLQPTTAGCEPVSWLFTRPAVWTLSGRR